MSVTYFLCLCKESSKENTTVPIAIGIDAAHSLCWTFLQPKSVRRG
jgi:hypothetical protein